MLNGSVKNGYVCDGVLDGSGFLGGILAGTGGRGGLEDRVLWCERSHVCLAAAVGTMHLQCQLRLTLCGGLGTRYYGRVRLLLDLAAEADVGERARRRNTAAVRVLVQRSCRNAIGFVQLEESPREAVVGGGR